jgi:tRNA 5-methylaminomethyl-2-thiouridine biosynthesis bifunctional protein
MWAKHCLQGVADNTADEGSFATFTAAGDVRRTLLDVGFEVNKSPGFAGKRDMLKGCYRLQAESSTQAASKCPWYFSERQKPNDKTVTIVGAGLAGAFTAASLAERGWQVTVIDRHSQPAQEASGNPVAVIFSKLSAFDGLYYRFNQQAYLYSVLRFQQLLNEGACWSACGMLQLAWNEKERRRQQDLLAARLWPDEWLQAVSASDASQLAGVKLSHSGLYFPQAGWVQPQAVCSRLLAKYSNINLLLNKQIEVIEQNPGSGRWRLYSADGTLQNESTVLVLANAANSLKFARLSAVPLKRVRGQITMVASTELSKRLRTVVCYEGYIAPVIDEKHCLGATFDLQDDEIEPRERDDVLNLQRLSAVEPALYTDLQHADSIKIEGHRAAVRCYTQDYMPIVGPVPDESFYRQAYAGLSKGQLLRHYPVGRLQKGLYLNVAHGSRGVTTAPLAAEVLAAYINQEPQLVPEQVRWGMHPARFLINGLRRGQQQA